MPIFELVDEARERYTIIRGYNYGSDLNVYKAYENNSETHYVIKSYKMRECFRNECQMLRELRDAKNVVQMIDVYPLQSIIICECALYDLEIFLHNQYNILRQEKKGNIIKDVVSGLLELKNHKIVHTKLSPKNIMYFQGKDGYTKGWKLIDFGSACFVDSYDSYCRKFKINYSAPEVIKADEKNIRIKVDFTMDMFSFGLILYFLETGHHYWNGENEEIKEEIISTKDLLLHDVCDTAACSAIKSLLKKVISDRMTLEVFMQTSYYICESSKQKSKKKVPTNSSKFEYDDEINEDEFQTKLTQEVQENYHIEMFDVLNENVTLNSISWSNAIPSNEIYLPEDFLVTKNWSYSKFNMKISTDPLDPYYALEYVFKILGELIENVVESGRKHFRKDDIMEITKKMRGHLKSFNQYWDNSDQKVQFISILKNQVHLYNHFLWLIVRYCAVKDGLRTVRLAAKISILYNDIIKIRSIIKAGSSFDFFLSKLNMALKSRDNDMINNELKSFVDDPSLNLKFDDEFLSRWISQIYSDIEFSSTKIETPPTVIFNTTKIFLNNTTITGKSLKYLNQQNLLCLIKEIYLYDSRQLNDNDYIIKFRGYSIHHCKCNLLYECADYDLFEYFQDDHNSSEHYHLSNWKNKIKLAWGISLGVKYLHNQKIVHLDLRSKNILLKYDENEKAFIPKISNFLWSCDLFSDKASEYPIITMSSGEEVWKRWYDPDRLYKIIFKPSTPSDIYSLGLLLWEIAWCKPANFPFKDVSINNLYDYLLKQNYEKLPKIPNEYQNWGHLIDKMWKFKEEDRCDIMTVESSMRKLFKDTDSA